VGVRSHVVRHQPMGTPIARGLGRPANSPLNSRLCEMSAPISDFRFRISDFEHPHLAGL
jgi:hypothetical protein